MTKYSENLMWKYYWQCVNIIIETIIIVYCVCETIQWPDVVLLLLNEVIIIMKVKILLMQWRRSVCGNYYYYYYYYYDDWMIDYEPLFLTNRNDYSIEWRPVLLCESQLLLLMTYYYYPRPIEPSNVCERRETLLLIIEEKYY